MEIVMQLLCESSNNYEAFTFLSLQYLNKGCYLIFPFPWHQLSLGFPHLLLAIIINLVERSQLISSNFQYVFQKVCSHRMRKALNLETNATFHFLSQLYTAISQNCQHQSFDLTPVIDKLISHYFSGKEHEKQKIVFQKQLNHQFVLLRNRGGKDWYQKNVSSPKLFAVFPCSFTFS